MSLFGSTMNRVFRNSSSPLAEAVTFKLNSFATAKIIYVNFFNEAKDYVMNDAATVRREPMCLANSDDVTGINHQSTITRNNVLYYVVKSESDDDGETIIYLSKQQII